MGKTINVLIVEDEPITLSLLKRIFKHLSDSYWNFKLHTAPNCDIALKKIKNAITGKSFDLVLLDINIPSSKDKKIQCGEDLGLELRNHFPKVKIIVYTAHNDNYRLHSILHSINPEGFLIKSDLDYKNLVNAINQILIRPPHYSTTIQSLMRQCILNEHIIDPIDKRLLYELSMGTRTKNLPSIINLSKSGVERRKRRLKEVFNIKEKGDKGLIQIAKKKGFI